MAAGYPAPGGHAFIADEFDRDGERLHVHALLYSDVGVDQRRLWGSWRKFWGRERILKFNPHLGASYYCAKYLLKESRRSADWRFVTWDDGRISDGSDIDIIEP